MSAGDAERLLERLLERGWSIGVAESLTGGLVVASLVSIPGASASVRGGVVAYATALKTSLLDVDPALLAAHGAVHPEVARQMADGIRRAAAIDGRQADVGLSTTGIAGPDSPDGQPVGTVFIGISTPEGTHVEALRLEGDRAQIRAETVRRALVAAREAL
ncbi:MAG TPA: nicotinamide-nucleotide amidohydrolase family protein [Microbacterium sp.]|uniref:CinA family protein n=1 Tax=Microbacterium sp. TaxID=51671 RepID=UPI002BF15BDF|nr:nicotinamide-nucleotide amidohydrolase family protein [Microbacterium sp.]HWI29920.1 nicotinamide-nucleotide amidohydrolase family protein [Microbacterium sp.]